LTTDEFQKLRFAVVATGGTVETADTFLDRFSRTMSEAAQGSNDLAKFFRLNGVAITDASGQLLPLNQLLGKYADLVKNARSPGDQLNLSFQVAGRQAGPQMVEVLREGAEGLRKFGIEAEGAGVIIDQALIERAKRANDEFGKFKLKVTTIFQEAALAAD